MSNQEVVAEQTLAHDEPLILWRRALTANQLKSLVQFGESFDLYPQVISGRDEDGLTVQITEADLTAIEALVFSAKRKKQ